MTTPTTVACFVVRVGELPDGRDTNRLSIGVAVIMSVLLTYLSSS